MMSSHNIHEALQRVSEDYLRQKGHQSGSVRKRGGDWYIAFRELIADENGNIKYRSTERKIDAQGAPRLTKRQAEELGYQQHVSKANGLTITPGAAATVQQFVDNRYRVDCMAGLAKGTLDTYEGTLTKHVLPSLGHCQLRDVSRAMVQTLISAKIRTGLSTESVRRVRNIIATIFRHAKRLNYVAGELPTEDLVMPRADAVKRIAPKSDQVALIKSFCDARTRLLIDFLCGTGARIGEAAGLRWDAVNLTDADIWHDGERVPPMCAFICRQYTRGEWKPVKTSKSRRMVPLTTAMAVQLMEWPGKRYETVFASRWGRPLSGKNHLRRALAPAAIKAGIPGIGWHHFRHAAASATDGVLSMAQRQALLGHTRATTTMGYTTVDLEKMRAAMDRPQ